MRFLFVSRGRRRAFICLIWSRVIQYSSLRLSPENAACDNQEAGEIRKPREYSYIMVESLSKLAFLFRHHGSKSSSHSSSKSLYTNESQYDKNRQHLQPQYQFPRRENKPVMRSPSLGHRRWSSLHQKRQMKGIKRRRTRIVISFCGFLFAWLRWSERRTIRAEYFISSVHIFPEKKERKNWAGKACD